MRTYDNYKDSGIQWIGEIPQYWEVKKLKYVASNNPSNVDKKSIENEKQVLLCNYVDVYKNDFITGDFTFMEATASDAQIKNFKLQKGDVLVTKDSETPEDIAIPALVKEDFENVICGYHLTQIRSNNEFLIGEFLFRLFQVDLYRQYFSTLARGVTRYGLTTSSFSEMSTILPPLPEQTAIANYLDSKTTEIDKVVADKEALVSLYEEEKKALINDAVTKGLNPAANLKPSEIDWLGDVPEHWEAVPLTKYLDSIVDYRGRTPNKIEEGVFLVTAKNVKNGIIDYKLSEEYVSEEEQHEFMKRGEVKIGDVLFTTEAPLGEVANIDRTDICLAQRIIKFRANGYFLNNYFLKFWLRSYSFQQDLQTYATGSTALGIKASKLNNLVLVLPPLEEQTTIVQYIESETANINDKINQIKQEIDFLKEYRQALIFEAVTGKVRVFD